MVVISLQNDVLKVQEQRDLPFFHRRLRKLCLVPAMVGSFFSNNHGHPSVNFCHRFRPKASFPTTESVEQANRRLKLRNYGFSGEDVSAKLVDGEAQQGIPVVSSLYYLKIQNEISVS